MNADSSKQKELNIVTTCYSQKHISLSTLILLLMIVMLCMSCAGPRLTIYTKPGDCQLYLSKSDKSLYGDANQFISSQTEKDFKYIGNSPYSLTLYPNIYYALKASAEGYKESRIFANPDFIKKNATQYELVINLGLGFNKGKISLTFNQTDVCIFLNGNLIDTVKSKFYEKIVEPGIYKIEVSKDGYRTKILECRLAPGDAFSADVNLEPVTYGYIKLTSNEDFVDVYVDKKFIGQIRNNQPLNKKIETGQHYIMAKKDFFMPKTIPATLEKNGVFPYHFQLVKVTGMFEQTPGQTDVVQATGNLTIGTERSDLKIYIEGAEKIPPVELKNMPAGIYRIKVVGPEIDKTFNVTVDVNASIFVDLDKEILENKQ